MYKYIWGDIVKRRVVSAVLVIAIIISAVFCFNTFTAFADDSGYCGYSSTMSGTGKNASYKFTEATGTLTISGTGATKNYGNTGTNARPWNDYRDKITTVVVEEGITEIGSLSFYNFPVLTSVSLPSSLTKIVGEAKLLGVPYTNYGAFRGCTALESIVLPEGLETIDNYAFVDCTALKTVKFPETLTSIGKEAFRGCTALENIKFPNSLTLLGQEAFRDCTTLKSVTYGTGMTSTGKYAFYDCTDLNTVKFSETITAIDAYSFYNTRITVIEIPETVTSIGTRAFANCAFISKVTVYNINCTFEGVKIGSTAGEDPFNGSSQYLTLYGYKGSTTETYANDKGYNFVSLSNCDHINTHTEIAIAPTCTEKGLEKKICDDCGDLVSETELAALGHTWKLTETENMTDSNGHIYSYYVCVNDGCTEEQVLIEHVNFVDGFYESTVSGGCTAAVETKKCLVEGCDKREITPIIGGNHQVEKYTVTKEATCTTDGSEEGLCSACNKTVTRTIPKTGHSNEVIATRDETETNGHTYIDYQCSVCGEKTTEPTHVEWVEGNYTSGVITEPRCVLPGVGRDLCNICSASRNYEIPATGKHEWYETTRTEPECAKDGTIFYSCRNCSLSKTESIPALGHSYVVQENLSVAPTCTDAGYTIEKCETCQMTKRTELYATGHTIDDTQYTIETEATCEEDGLAHSVCTVCGESFDIVLEKLGHSMAIVITSIEDKPGHSMHTPTCSRCNHIDPGTVNHDEWIEGYYTEEFKEGTCLIGSEYKKSCTLCTETETQRGEATGHKYSYTSTQNNGTLVYKCIYCPNERTYNPTYVSALFPQYINSGSEDSPLSYLFELNKDGVINAKDYSLINKAVVQSKAYN